MPRPWQAGEPSRPQRARITGSGAARVRPQPSLPRAAATVGGQRFGASPARPVRRQRFARTVAALRAAGRRIAFGALRIAGPLGFRWSLRAVPARCPWTGGPVQDPGTGPAADQSGSDAGQPVLHEQSLGCQGQHRAGLAAWPAVRRRGLSGGYRAPWCGPSCPAKRCACSSRRSPSAWRSLSHLRRPAAVLRSALVRRRVLSAPTCAYRRLLAAGSAWRAALYIMDLARPGAA